MSTAMGSANNNVIRSLSVFHLRRSDRHGFCILRVFENSRDFADYYCDNRAYANGGAFDEGLGYCKYTVRIPWNFNFKCICDSYVL